MKKYGWIAMLAAVMCFVAAGTYAAEDGGALRLGAGAHYWKTLDDIDADNVDEDGFSYYASLQYWPGLLGVELDLEWFDKGFAGSTETVYEPQAYLLLGGLLYAGAGVGGYYSDGDFAEDPFFAFRVGVDLPLGFLHIDINANYRFEKWDDISNDGTEIDSDTITLGGAVRVAF